MDEITKQRYEEWKATRVRDDATRLKEEAVGDALSDVIDTIVRKARDYGLPEDVEYDEVYDVATQVDFRPHVCQQERSWDDADVVLSETLRVYVLQPNEWLDFNTSRFRGHHRATGPAIVTIDTSYGGSKVNEYYAHDPKVWVWLGDLLKRGFDAKLAEAKASDEL